MPTRVERKKQKSEVGVLISGLIVYCSSTSLVFLSSLVGLRKTGRIEK